MEIITKPECEAWLARNVGDSVTLKTIGSEYRHWVRYKLPVDTGEKTRIAHLFSSVDYVVELKPPLLLWITEWGVWPYCENPRLFYRYRQALGEDRRLIEAPGHIIGEADIEDLECLLDLSLYFYWDAYLFDAAGTIVFHCCHDEWFGIDVKDDDQLQGIVERLKPYELERIDGMDQ